VAINLKGVPCDADPKNETAVAENQAEIIPIERRSPKYSSFKYLIRVMPA
jgi:hypothetical protein